VGAGKDAPVLISSYVTYGYALTHMICCAFFQPFGLLLKLAETVIFR